MKTEVKRKRSGFLSAVGFFTFFFLLLVSIAIAVAYINRDRLILEYVRQEGARLLGAEVFAVDSISTRPIGQVSIEIRNLVFRSSPSAPLIRAEKVLLSTPKNILSLYQLMFSHEVLPLKAQLVSVQIRSTQEGASKAPTPVGTAEIRQAARLPFPIDMETEIRDSTFETGSSTNPLVFRRMTGIIRTEIFNRQNTNPTAVGIVIRSTGQLSLGVAMGERAQLPIRTDWTITVDPSPLNPKNVSFDVTSLTVSTLGISLKSKGNVKWPEQTFSIEAAGSTTDLGVLPIDKNESEALGLTGRLKGSAEISVKLSGDLQGAVSANGSIRLKDGQFPFDLKREKPKAFQIKGPIDLDLETPFKFVYHVPTAKFKSIDLTLANFRVDLTAADIRIPGQLNKPAQTMMGLRGQMTAQGETIDLSLLEFRFANLLVNTNGQISIDPKRHSKLDVQLTLPSLKGWPALLPFLGNLETGATSAAASATDLSRAQGSFALKAHLELPLGAPETLLTDSNVNIEIFDADRIEFPIAIKGEKRTVEGVVRGSLLASGGFTLSPEPKAPFSWFLKRAQGTLDLRNLKVNWDDLVKKTSDQEASVTFLASAPQMNVSQSGGGNSELNVRIDRFDLHVGESTVSTKGSITRVGSDDIRLNTTFVSRTVLGQIYEIAPRLRSLQSKLPSGTFMTNLQIDGTYKLKDGPDRSPLALKGRMVLKSPRAVLLDISPAAEAPAIETPVTSGAPSPQTNNASAMDSFLKWPLLERSKLVFDIQIENIAAKTATFKNVALLANLQGGNLRGSMSSANIFGGPMKVTSFAVLDLPKRAFRDLRALASGNFQSMSLALFADFLSPQWKSLVGGLATGNFSFTGLPFHQTSLADNANLNGTLAIKQGHLSTVSFDKLVNQKLTENPEIAKLLGVKPKVATGGANLDMNTSYVYAKGRMTVKDFKMISPEKNEIVLEGWIQKDLMAELKGFAYLADTPVGGSIRQHNSDKLGRLIVPIKISGSLKAPSLEIAEEVIKAMTTKTVKGEVEKVIEQKKQELQKNAVDAVKEELKKRGFGF